MFPVPHPLTPTIGTHFFKTVGHATTQLNPCFPDSFGEEILTGLNTAGHQLRQVRRVPRSNKQDGVQGGEAKVGNHTFLNHCA